MTGRTFADFLTLLITDGRRAFTLLCGIVMIFALLTIFLVITLNLLGLTATDATLGSTNTKVAFTHSEGSFLSHKKAYVVVVSPQGWQNTEIEVKRGDRFDVAAGGKINVNLQDIVESVRERNEEERRILAQNPGLKKDPKKAPEDFPQFDVTRFRLDLPWNGPEGVQAAETSNEDPSYSGRTARRVKPDAPLGALIGYVAPPGTTDEQLWKKPAPYSELFVYPGKATTLTADKDGVLWFTVNDVMYQGADWRDDDLFFRDNVGSFWINLSSPPKSR